MNYCDCTFDYYNDMHHETPRKARKEHSCFECSEVIFKGDDYFRIAICGDGSWQNLNLCEYCKHDWDFVFSLGKCGAYGELKEIFTSIDWSVK